MSGARRPVPHAGINESTRKLLRQCSIESFWGTLKSELVYQRRFTTREEARRAISEYIEIFYNWQRTQVRLDYLSPIAFTQRYYLNQVAA